MASADFLSQEDMFYGSMWSRDLESVLVSILEDEAKYGRLKLPTMFAASLRCARIGIKRVLGVDVTFDQCHERMEVLRSRLEVFHYLLGVPSVTWNRASNKVRSPAGFVTWVVKESPLATAYVSEGEGFYESLLIIFGKPDQREDPPRPLESILRQGVVFGCEKNHPLPESPAGSSLLVEIDRAEFELKSSSANRRKALQRFFTTLASSPEKSHSQGANSVNDPFPPRRLF